MSGNLNQSVRRTITNTPPIVSLMKSSPKARIPANKKRNTTREFFSKQLLKNEDLFTIMLSFVLSLFLEQKQEDMSMTINDDIKQACEVMQRGGTFYIPPNHNMGYRLRCYQCRSGTTSL